MSKAATRLKISEIFYSLQGEASRVGLPTVFVRLTGCPLRCVWCDTAHAFSGGESLTVNEILSKVGTYNTPHVCVTGGEPLSQKACLVLLSALADAGYKVSLETSGALDVSGVDERVSRIMDLKAPGSGESEKNLWANLDHLGPGDEIKIIIADRNDYEWARRIITTRELHKISPVLLSPAQDTQDPTQLAEWILEDHLKVRFQLQLHKLLWGNIQGK